MIEKQYTLTETDKKIIEKVVVNEHLHYMHVVLPQHEGLPLHQSNANVYMTILKGTVSIGLDDQEVKIYYPMSLLEIPFNTKMNVRNEHPELLEMIIVKSPSPGDDYYNNID